MDGSDDSEDDDGNNEKEDIKNIMETRNINELLQYSEKEKETNSRGYKISKKNLNKPVARFKICDYCNKFLTYCKCQEKIIEEQKMELIDENNNLKPEPINPNLYKYKKLPPSLDSIKTDLKESKKMTLYQ